MHTFYSSRSLSTTTSYCLKITAFDLKLRIALVQPIYKILSINLDLYSKSLRCFDHSTAATSQNALFVGNVHISIFHRYIRLNRQFVCLPRTLFCYSDLWPSNRGLLEDGTSLGRRCFNLSCGRYNFIDSDSSILPLLCLLFAL